MKKYVHIYTLFLLFVFNFSCEGQNKTDLPKESIKSETEDMVISSGPNRITRNIIQDRKGNIWIAAFDGIFRYDGKSFTNITSKVSSARFFSVLEDRKGNFWFASVGSGVYYYDGKSFRNFTTKDGLANNSVTEIYEDKIGDIWFGTGAGASRYDGKFFRTYKMDVGFQTPPSNHDNDVNAIIEDKTGKFWFGTRGNTFVYDRKTFIVFTHEGRPLKNVRAIIEDKKGNVWLGGNDGLWRYDGSTFTNFTQKFVGYIYEDKKGNIWTSSEKDNNRAWVLSRYDRKSLSNKKPTITEITNKPMIFGILEARDGNIWFGALDGMYRYDGSIITSFSGKKGQK